MQQAPKGWQAFQVQLVLKVPQVQQAQQEQVSPVRQEITVLMDYRVLLAPQVWVLLVRLVTLV